MNKPNIIESRNAKSAGSDYSDLIIDREEEPDRFVFNILKIIKTKLSKHRYLNYKYYKQNTTKSTALTERVEGPCK